MRWAYPGRMNLPSLPGPFLCSGNGAQETNKTYRLGAAGTGWAGVGGMGSGEEEE